MTTITQGRERAKKRPDPRGAAPVPEQLPDQARLASESRHDPPGSGSNGQQPTAVSESRTDAAAGTNGQGRAKHDSGSGLLAPAPAYRELRVFAELYADVQQTRIACANRAERGGLDPTILTAYLTGLRESEHKLGLAMVRCYRRVVDPPIREWQQATPGIGEHLLARLLGAIGHPRHATPYHWEGSGPERVLIADAPFERRVSDLWSYCGHGDPARRRRKGMTAEEGAALGNPRAKMLVHLLAEAAMKCVGSVAIVEAEATRPPPAIRAHDGGQATHRPQPVLLAAARRRSPYRDIYEQTRATYADRKDDDDEDWPPARKHAAALRRVGKEILRDLWLAAGDHPAVETPKGTVPGGQP